MKVPLEIERYFTEDPIGSIWERLLRYGYPENVRRFHAQQKTTAAPDIPDYISGCLRQAHAYFRAAGDASLDISPLLLYYGATNLLSGAYALIRGTRPPTAHHGMTPEPLSANIPIGDTAVQTHASHDGALRVFTEAFDPNYKLEKGQVWALWELVASIPDLKREFSQAYPGRAAFTLLLECVRGPDRSFDRVSNAEFETLRNPSFDFSSIHDFGKAYLAPQSTGEYHVFYRRRPEHRISTASINGDTHLIVPHEKLGKPVAINQITAMLMALYSAGMLTRYQPALWHPFVHTDGTGERHVIEGLVNAARRFFPNLLLNEIERKEIRFLFSNHDVRDYPPPLTKEQIKAIVNEELDAGTRRRAAL